MYNPELRQHIARLLQEAKTGTVSASNVGICSHLSFAGAHYDEYSELMLRWPMRKPHALFPIEGRRDRYSKPGKWKGKRLAKRIALLEYMLSELTENEDA